jgi:hypothetical protein
MQRFYIQVADILGTLAVTRCERRSKSALFCRHEKMWHKICGGFSRTATSNRWWPTTADQKTLSRPLAAEGGANGRLYRVCWSATLGHPRYRLATAKTKCAGKKVRICTGGNTRKCLPPDPEEKTRCSADYDPSRTCSAAEGRHSRAAESIFNPAALQGPVTRSAHEIGFEF